MASFGVVLPVGYFYESHELGMQSEENKNKQTEDRYPQPDYKKSQPHCHSRGNFKILVAINPIFMFAPWTVSCVHFSLFIHLIA
jgi:hypothetical protein